MKYHYRIWCHDCTGSDPQGCFDGDTSTSDETFDTPEEAADAGSEMTSDVGPWDYYVVDENGKDAFQGLLLSIAIPTRACSSMAELGIVAPAM